MLTKSVCCWQWTPCEERPLLFLSGCKISLMSRSCPFPHLIVPSAISLYAHGLFHRTDSKNLLRWNDEEFIVWEQGKAPSSNFTWKIFFLTYISLNSPQHVCFLCCCTLFQFGWLDLIVSTMYMSTSPTFPLFPPKKNYISFLTSSLELYYLIKPSLIKLQWFQVWWFNLST